MSIYDKPMTFEELTMEATQYIEDIKLQIAEDFVGGNVMEAKSFFLMFFKA